MAAIESSTPSFLSQVKRSPRCPRASMLPERVEAVLASAGEDGEGSPGLRLSLRVALYFIAIKLRIIIMLTGIIEVLAGAQGRPRRERPDGADPTLISAAFGRSDQLAMRVYSMRCERLFLTLYLNAGEIG